ncbi:MAG: 5'/3'-nucleotidase SurE [Anaerolineales bacterium]|nr:5'/3'-nucleotidase SurE [Anaerolineales bacterium]
MSTRLILLTNDDGVESPGLWAAAASLKPLGEVVIVAPMTQCTSVGRAMPPTYSGRIERRTFSVNGSMWHAFAVDASPALAVQHAALEILPRQPDLVVAGINFGENIGSAVTVSGTVGAAMEGASLGVPALAISQETDPAHYYTHSTDVDFTAAAHFTQLFARLLLTRPLPFDVDLLKVEVPLGATPQTPWRLTRLSRTRYYLPVKPQRSDLLQPGQITAINRLEPERLEPDSDVYALVVDRCVAVTPLSLDLTSRVSLKELAERLGKVEGT